MRNMAIVSRDSSPRLKAGAPSQQNDGINGKAEVNCLGFPVFFSRRCRHCCPWVASPAAVAGIPLPHCCRLIRRLIHQSNHIPRPSSTCSRMDSAEAAAPAAAPVGLGPVVPLPLLPWPLPQWKLLSHLPPESEFLLSFPLRRGFLLDFFLLFYSIEHPIQTPHVITALAS